MLTSFLQVSTGTLAHSSLRDALDHCNTLRFLSTNHFFTAFAVFWVVVVLKCPLVSKIMFLCRLPDDDLMLFFMVLFIVKRFPRQLAEKHPPCLTLGMASPFRCKMKGTIHFFFHLDKEDDTLLSVLWSDERN